MKLVVQNSLKFKILVAIIVCFCQFGFAQKNDLILQKENHNTLRINYSLSDSIKVGNFTLFSEINLFDTASSKLLIKQNLPSFIPVNELMIYLFISPIRLMEFLMDLQK